MNKMPVIYLVLSVALFMIVTSALAICALVFQ